MDYGLNVADGLGDITWDLGESLVTSIYLCLFVKRGSFFMDPEFGSRLHLLEREKSLENKAALARDYCTEALERLIRTGRARAIDVETALDRDVPGRLLIRVVATKGDGQTVPFETFWRVA